MSTTGMSPNAIGYSTALNAAQNGCPWELSSSILRDVRVATLDIGAQGFSAAVRAAKVWPQALQLRAEMARCRAQPDQCTYNAELHAMKSWHQAVQLSRTLAPDCIAANMVINACAGAGEWGQAMVLLESMASVQLEPDVISCSTALGACERIGHWTLACHLLGLATRLQVRPNLVTLGTLVGSCGREWRVASGILMRLPMLSLECDTVASNSAVNSCEKATAWEPALGLLRGTADVADVVAFTSALCACASRWRLALALLPEMRTLRLAPDDVCFNAAIDVCASAGQVGQAWDLLQASERVLRTRPISSLPWALARLHVADPHLVQSCFAEAAPQLVAASAQQLATVIWAFATLGLQSPLFAEAVAARLDDFGLDDLSMISWALIGTDAGALGAGLCHRVQEAAVKQMRLAGRLQAAKRVEAVLGVVWAWNFLGLLGRPLLATARRTVLRAARAKDDLKGTEDVSGARGAAKPGKVEGTKVVPAVHKDPVIVLDLSDRLVIGKPPGWEVYGGMVARQLSEFLAGQRGRRPILKDLEHGCGFIHRLDVPSSGLVLAGTTYQAWYDLQLQLVSGTLLREYLVLCHGLMPKSFRELRASLRWNESPVSAGSFGKPCRTFLRVVGHGFYRFHRRAGSLLVIRIGTGRKHQIRSHAAWAGHPTWADGKYVAWSTAQEDFAFCARNFVHRCHLGFDAGRHDVWQPLAPDLVSALKELEPKNAESRRAFRASCAERLEDFVRHQWGEKNVLETLEVLQTGVNWVKTQTGTPIPQLPGVWYMHERQNQEGKHQPWLFFNASLGRYFRQRVGDGVGKWFALDGFLVLGWRRCESVQMPPGRFASQAGLKATFQQSAKGFQCKKAAQATAVKDMVSFLEASGLLAQTLEEPSAKKRKSWGGAAAVASQPAPEQVLARKAPGTGAPLPPGIRAPGQCAGPARPQTAPALTPAKTPAQTFEGNFTLEIARGHLNEHLRKWRQPTEMQLLQQGPPHLPQFRATLLFEVKNERFFFSHTATNKKQVQNELALKVCRKLYALGLMREYKRNSTKGTFFDNLK
ncbi:unnamed protein product, partial [Effrenium voratum]